MKSLTESIQTINEGQYVWQVADRLFGNKVIDRFKAPDKDYLWINPSGDVMTFCTSAEIQSAFEDEGTPEFSSDIKNMKVGDAFSPDGINIYVKIKD